MIRAVLFDMYETLCTHYRSPLYFGAQIADDCGVDRNLFLSLWRDGDRETARTLGHLTLAGMLEDILPRCGIADPVRRAELIQLVYEKRIQCKTQCLHTLHPEILPMLHGLKARGMKLGVISNCYDEEARAIRAWTEGRCFDTLTLSCEEHLQKPDPAIFRRCMDRLDVAPEECLYIGDGGSRELEMARSLGMEAAQATWYFLATEGYPSAPKEGFFQLGRPMEVVGMCAGVFDA